MQNSLIIDSSKCTSCLQCEMACSYHHTGAFNPARSRIKVFEIDHGSRSIPYTCTQCSDAWCMKACPTNALSRNSETGAIELSEQSCVGCKVCTLACPFGTINFNQDNGKVAKCDLCGGDPECAKACPTGAISFGDTNWTGLSKMRESALQTDEVSNN